MRPTAFAIILAGFVTTQATAATISVADGVTYITGDITVGDAGQFFLLDPPKLVVLNSEGGVIDDALLMAKRIHKAGASTVIPAGAECWSACSMLFLAGKERYMGEGATLGVHAGWNAIGWSVEGTEEMADYLTDLATAPLDVVYALMSTPPDQMWILPRERWEELHITEWKTPLE